MRVHVLGEDLVAFRDTRGQVGLVDARCPHRGADLFFGRNEECGLRCVYHGWKFDVDGRCVDMPTMARDERLRAAGRAHGLSDARVRRPHLGLPRAAGARAAAAGARVRRRAAVPPLRVARSCRSATGRRRARAGSTPPTSRSCTCRWRSPDIPPERRRHPLHNAAQWMRDDPAPVSTSRARRRPGRSAASRRADEDDLYWRITQYLLPNHSLAPGSRRARPTSARPGCPSTTSCWVYGYTWNPDRPLTDARTASSRACRACTPRSTSTSCRSATAPTTTSSTARSRSTRTFTGIEGISEQDAAIQDSQGLIADRTREHLGPTDLGIVRFRRSSSTPPALAAGLEPPAAANSPDVYRVRGGGIIAPADPAASRMSSTAALRRRDRWRRPDPRPDLTPLTADPSECFRLHRSASGRAFPQEALRWADRLEPGAMTTDWSTGSRRAPRPRGGRRRRDARRRPRHRGRAGRARRHGRLHRPHHARRGLGALRLRPPETIEETAELVTALGGTGHRRSPSTTSIPTRCSALAERLRVEHGAHRRPRQRHLGSRGAEGRAAGVEHADLGARPRRRPADPPARRSTPTSSRRTSCCRSWSTGRAASWSRSPTAPPRTTRPATGSRCSTTWPRSR